MHQSATSVSTLSLVSIQTQAMHASDITDATLVLALHTLREMKSASNTHKHCPQFLLAATCIPCVKNSLILLFLHFAMQELFA